MHRVAPKKTDTAQAEGSATETSTNGGAIGNASKLPKRDGIPSDNQSDRLLYYLSTQQDAPGLYAFRPTTPEAAPVNVDPTVNLITPLAYSIPLATFSVDSKLNDFHPGGVFYSTYYASESYADRPGMDFLGGRTHLVRTEPAQLTTSPRQTSNAETSSSMLNLHNVESFSRTNHGFFIQLSSLEGSAFREAAQQPLLHTFDMDAESEPLKVPAGHPIFIQSNEPSNRWLFVEKNGDLVSYDRDFS